MTWVRYAIRVRGGIRQALLLVGLALVATVACSPADDAGLRSSPWPDTAEPALATSARVYSLLANGELVVADAVAGTIAARLSLATLPPTGEAHVMALSPDQARLVVLVTDVHRGGQIITVDTRALQIASVLTLPGGLEYRGLALGPTSGNVYVFANRGRDALVLVVEPGSGTIRQQWTARASRDLGWLIYQGAVSDDETSIFLSYHGPDTLGTDRFDIQGAELKRCALPSDANSGCFRTHGGFALTSAGLLAATGDPFYYLLDPRTGAHLATFQAQLPGNHLMEFALAERVGWIYAVGSCGYVGGLSVSDIRAHRVRVLAPGSAPGGICGQRIALLDDASILVVGKTRRPGRGLEPGELTVLSASGAVVHRIATAAEVVDLLLVR